jgi:hypothetical protein
MHHTIEPGGIAVTRSAMATVYASMRNQRPWKSAEASRT